MKSQKSKSVTVRIPDKMHDSLRNISADSGLSVSDLVRAALAVYLSAASDLSASGAARPTVVAPALTPDGYSHKGEMMEQIERTKALEWKEPK